MCHCRVPDLLERVRASFAEEGIPIAVEINPQSLIIVAACTPVLSTLHFHSPMVNAIDAQVLYCSEFNGRFYGLSISLEDDQNYLLSCYEPSTARRFETAAPDMGSLLASLEDGLRVIGYFDAPVN